MMFSRGFRAVVRGVRPPPSTTAFASFSQTSRPRRKMRGGGAAEVQNNQAPPVPPPVTQQEHSAQRMPEEMFAQIIQNTTLKVQTALEGMAEVNEGFTISRDQNGMGITVHIGPNTKILIEGTPDTQVLHASFPISGGQTYSLGSDGRWVATTDGHDFEGVVTRDLLRLCSGCPAF